MARLKDIRECNTNTLRYTVTSEGIQVAEYNGRSSLPNWQAPLPENVTVQEASPTAKSGKRKAEKLEAPIDYMVLVTARNQYPRGVYRPDRKVAGRTAAEGFIDIDRVLRQVRGFVSERVRFIP